MPILDQPWSQADYDSAYRLQGEPKGHPNTRDGVTLGYHRYSVKPVLLKRWTHLAPKLGLTSTDRVVIIGAGFGWGTECLEQVVPGVDAVGTDISSFVQTEKGNTEVAELQARIAAVGLDPGQGLGLELLMGYHDGGPRARTAVADEHISDNGSRNRVRGFLGGGVDWVVTEDTLACLSDAGVVALAQACDQLNPVKGVVHTVALAQLPQDDAIMSQDPGYNWKRPAPWRALFDANGLSSHQLIEAVIQKQDFF